MLGVNSRTNNQPCINRNYAHQQSTATIHYQLHQHRHALHINCNQLCTIYHIHIDINITYLHLYINKQYSIKYIQYKCIIKHTQPVTPSCTLPKPYYPQYNLPGDSTLYSWDMIDTLTIAQDMTYLLSYMMCMSMNRAIMYHLYTYSVHDLCETCVTPCSRHQHHMIYYTVLCVV